MILNIWVSVARDMIFLKSQEGVQINHDKPAFDVVAIEVWLYSVLYTNFSMKYFIM